MPNLHNDESPELRKFYEKICLLLADLNLQPDDSSKTQDEEKLSLDKPLEEELYGKIGKDEFIKILESYNKQQESQELQEKPVECGDRVDGGNYAKLLYSKTGFHHLGSTSYLARELQIRNTHRNSFQGGLSTFCPGIGEDLAGLKKYHEKVLIKQITDRAIEYIGKNQLDLASREILIAYHMDQKNGDVLATRGRYYAAKKEYSPAIGFLKSALNHRPHDEYSVRMHLSDTLYQFGLAKYNRREYKEAKELLADALIYNPDSHGAKLHRDLCEDELRKNTLFAQKPPSYRK